MTRTMHDAVYASNIPTGATLVAGYLDKTFAWSGSDWARFPYATLVRITIDPSLNDGQVIDIEPGNWEPPSAPGWCRMRRAAGVTPTVYTMGSWWQWCIDEFNRQGEPQPHYWIADWDGDATLPHGAVAKQHSNGAMLGTGYDLSVVADHWPGVDEEDDMPSAKEIVDELLSRDVADYPWEQAPDNPTWTIKNMLEDTWKHAYWISADVIPAADPEVTKNYLWYGRNALGMTVKQGRDILAQVAGLTAALEALASAQGVDPKSVTNAAAEGVRNALEQYELTLDVQDKGDKA